jgi:hypothetical protein
VVVEQRQRIGRGKLSSGGGHRVWRYVLIGRPLREHQLTSVQVGPVRMLSGWVIA